MQVTVETQHRRVCSLVANGFGIKRMRDKVRLTAKVLSGRKHLQQVPLAERHLRRDDVASDSRWTWKPVIACRVCLSCVALVLRACKNEVRLAAKVLSGRKHLQ